VKRLRQITAKRVGRRPVRRGRPGVDAVYNGIKMAGAALAKKAYRAVADREEPK